MTRKIDHIVYCVPNLEKAVADLESKLGIKAKIGGRHLTEGTKNAIINLGNKCYLEILAIDHNNKEIQGPRWMGIDLIQSPKITRWALKSSNINEDSKALSKHNPQMGQVQGGSRKMQNGDTLTWEIAMPLSQPEIEIAPFITDWSNSETHPTDNLNDQCELLELRLMHPKSHEFKNLFDTMNIDIRITFSEKASIGISIKCPNGIVQL